MQKRILFLVLILILVILLIPTLLVTISRGSQSEKVSAETIVKKNTVSTSSKSDLMIRVYLTKEKRVVQLPLEDYIQGVVASEMPANFNKEALKAQALAARTYIIDHLMKKDHSDLASWGKIAQTAYVTDTVQHQVYSTDKQLRKNWGSKYENYKKQIQEAVQETAGEIITFQGKPIYAAFFSTSNGKTENSEDYFTNRYPYLRSVDSSWDQQSPKYLKEQSLTVSGLTKRLEQKTGKPLAIPTSSGQPLMRVIERTNSHRIATIQIGDQKFTGREVREALNLASSDFNWQVKGKQILFVTHGFGHGVGMSQWGANLMAQTGKNAIEIIKHYYQGVQVKKIDLRTLK